jgi:hypothetical protein
MLASCAEQSSKVQPWTLQTGIPSYSEQQAVAKAKNIDGGAAGLAALSICESLLLALGDRKVMGEQEIVGVIADAADAHRFAGESSGDIRVHLEVTAILDKIITGGNSVRRR